MYVCLTLIMLYMFCFFVEQEFFPPNKQTQEMFEKHFNAHGLEKLVQFQVSMQDEH